MGTLPELFRPAGEMPSSVDDDIFAEGAGVESLTKTQQAAAPPVAQRKIVSARVLYADDGRKYGLKPPASDWQGPFQGERGGTYWLPPRQAAKTTPEQEAELRGRTKTPEPAGMSGNERDLWQKATANMPPALVAALLQDEISRFNIGRRPGSGANTGGETFEGDIWVDGSNPQTALHEIAHRLDFAIYREPKTNAKAKALLEALRDDERWQRVTPRERPAILFEQLFSEPGSRPYEAAREKYPDLIERAANVVADYLETKDVPRVQTFSVRESHKQDCDLQSAERQPAATGKILAASCGARLGGDNTAGLHAARGTVAQSAAPSAAQRKIISAAALYGKCKFGPTDSDRDMGGQTK